MPMTVISWRDAEAFVEKIVGLHGRVPDSHKRNPGMSGGFAKLNDYFQVTLVATFLRYDTGG